MRIINSRGLSDRGNPINEDIFNIEENAAWVSDGFSQYYDTLNIEKDSDSFIKLVKE